MRRMPALLFLLVAALLAPPPEAAAQGLAGSAERVTWTATVAPSAVAPGEAAQLVLRAEIDEGWKMYAMDSPPPTRGVAPALAALPAGLSQPSAGEDASGFTQSAPREGYDQAFRKNVRYFEGAATLRTDLAVGANATPGEREIGGAINFMVCDLEKCLPPTDESFRATLTVAPPRGEGASSGEAP